MTDYLETPQGRRIAYESQSGQGPGVVFLGGFKSDMTGTTALFLQDWAQRQGRAFLRFDYSGHGESSGDFEEGCIGDWFAEVSLPRQHEHRTLEDLLGIIAGSGMDDEPKRLASKCTMVNTDRK